MKKFTTFLLLSTASLIANADVVTDADLQNYGKYTVIGYNRVSVHDPSIFVDNITNPGAPYYYVYGSHLATAKGELSNTQNWAAFDPGETDACNLFVNSTGARCGYQNAYSEPKIKTFTDCNGETQTLNFNAHGWQNAGYQVRGNQWAPDVVYNKTMKKWCMYMSVNGDKWCSSIVLMTSDKPQGPWQYQGPVVMSGFNGVTAHNSYEAANDYKYSDLELAIGKQSSLPKRYNVTNWGSYWPNAIDPCVFYDDNDNLWMSYGSWSGGIFLLQLDENTGLRDYKVKYEYQVNGTAADASGSASEKCTQDPYFGKKIAGGCYVSGEASYIQKVGKYYFLFVTYGGLSSVGGYQMRVFRADKPDGDYKDANNIGAIYGDYRMNYGGGANTQRGMKLMGGYQWDNMDVPEIAQGHNSAINAVSSNGKEHSLVVYHTRFWNGTEGHQMRMHQLFLNADGWIVSSPFEYHNATATSQEEIEAKQSYKSDDVVGTYQVIRHFYQQNCQQEGNGKTWKDVEFQKPVNMTLLADGTITSTDNTLKGTWSLNPSKSFITLVLDGVTFEGVLFDDAMDYTSDLQTLCISAMGNKNGLGNSGRNTTKGLQLWAVKTDSYQAIQYNIDHLLSDNLVVSNDLTLGTGFLGATVEWSSSNESVLSSTGVMGNDGECKLTAKITHNGYVYEKVYNVKVDQNNSEIFYPEAGSKLFTNSYLSSISEFRKVKKGGSLHIKFYNYTKGDEAWHNWYLLCCSGPGLAATGAKEYFILRADNWENIKFANDGCTSNFNWGTFKTDMNGAIVDMTVTFAADGTVSMTSTITTAIKKEYNYSYKYGTKLTSVNELYFSIGTENSYVTAGDLKPTAIEDVNAESNFGTTDTYDIFGRKQKIRNGLNISDGNIFIIR